MPPRNLLFVYGTLLPGLCRHPAMQGARWLGRAGVRAQLYDLGPYPGLILTPARAEAAAWVWGQVAEVDDALLGRLDAIEAYDPDRPAQSEYVRLGCDAHLAMDDPQAQADAKVVRAWVYVYNRSLQHARRIAHGDYVRHLDETGFTPVL
jgi:gamma-glutamylcyclotransferase (GGCT)/AIG2-like uncharacterized protein YtfP